MKPKTEIIVYPDNSLCIDGRLKGADPSLLAELDIEGVRKRDQIIHTGTTRIVVFDNNTARRHTTRYCAHTPKKQDDLRAKAERILRAIENNS